MQAAITNPQGENIATTWTPGVEGSQDVVVIGHGLTSDKERPWSSALSAELAREGVASLRIAFSGNGDSGGRFEDSCITKEVADLGSVLDALGDRRISYVGHSMGAAVGVITASRDERIRNLVSLAGMVHTREFIRRMFGDLRPGEPMLGKDHCRLSTTLVDDLEAIDSVAPLGARIRVPWLLVHGNADDVVPIQHARDIHEVAGGRSQLVELEGVDHSFSRDGLGAMTVVVVPWLSERVANPGS